MYYMFKIRVKMDLMLISTPVEYNTGKGLATEEKTEQLYSYVACTYTNCQ